MIHALIRGFMDGNLIGKTIKYGKYYTNIEELPVYNFFKLMKGHFEYLWINEKDYSRKYPKGFFLSILQEMYFQFPNLDNSNLRDKATLEDYRSKFIRTNDYRWKNEYNTLAKKLETEVVEQLNLDDFTDTIEHAFNNPIGSIDTKKVSTLKAFNNYYRAIKKHKKQEAA